jgi:hypothetical protein
MMNLCTIFAVIMACTSALDQVLLNELKAIRTSIIDLDRKVVASIIDLDRKVVEGFQMLHDFPKEKVKVLQSVTDRATIAGCNGALTRHTVFFRGKVADIFPIHFDCVDPTTNSPIYVGNFTNVFASPKYDLAVSTSCPNTTHALDISQYVVPDLGDEVLCFGYGDIAHVWRGFISKIITSTDPTKCNGTVPWTKATTMCDGEFLVQAHQHTGLSGSAVANSCGYTGMAHITVTDSMTTGFAGVIGAAAIIELISELLPLLPDAASCGVIPITLPTSPFVTCAAPMTAMATYIVSPSATVQLTP